MKNDYTKIDAAVSRLAKARSNLARKYSLNMGLISGMASADDEKKELAKSLSRLVELTQTAINNNARLSTLLTHLDGELVTTEMVNIEIFDRESKKRL